MLFSGVNRQFHPVRPVERPQIVKPGHMIRMGMGDEKCVDLFQTQRQQLVAYVRPRIDKNVGGVCLDQNGTALPAVSRVVRITRAPSGAADGRHTNRCSASEKRNLHPSPILENRRRVLARVMAVMRSASVLRISASLASVWLV